ncbi:MAG: RNA-binding transcriptional accessory protein [Coprobacillus sp.]|nr:RNA-binding transcriptional accessory protein [Coprobacillus sp.]
MEIREVLAQEFSLKQEQVDAVLSLLEEGNTIPFIARYRKEVTGSLDDEILRKFYDRYTYLLNLEDRRKTILKSIEEQGKLTDELKASIMEAKTLTELEDIYRPYKPKKKTIAIIAKEKGLEPLADYLLKQEETTPLMEYASTFIDVEKKVETVEDALQGARDIIAEIVADDADYRRYARFLFESFGKIVTKENVPDEKGIFDMYKDYQEAISKIASHRILAINRGENVKALKVTLEVPDEDIIRYIVRKVVKENSPFKEQLQMAIEDGYKRLIRPSLETEIRNALTEKAEEASLVVFKENLHQVLLVAPMKNKVVLGLDPGYAHGCKIAVIDGTGKVLDTTVVYPTPPRNQVDAAKNILSRLILKYKVDLIAIGNGTASRESELFVKNLIQELHPEHPISFVIVNEAGASIYSASKLAAKEFPDYDVNLRSAVSIARRLQDPLAELVKITPESIGVGQYQHDMNQKRLKEVLGGVVENCVNTVGVDLNSASPSLLEYVSGISSALATSIVSYREENGAFKKRADLLKVPKLGPKAYEQCAGFLRVRDGNPLDNTGVHPESYEVATKLLQHLGYKVEDIQKPEVHDALENLYDIASLASQLGVGEPTLKDMIEEMKKPGRDPRDEAEGPVLRSDVMSIEDLKEGMILKGTVRNIMDFGVFVDIGVHQDGLVHISELASRFVKHPLEVVNVNDIVSVKVIGVDVKKGRISLSMKQAK